MNTKLFLAGIFIAASLFCFAQNEQKTVIRKDKRGNIQSVEFSSTDRSVALPVSADDFFRNMLKIRVNDRFEKERKDSEDREFKNEYFDQYYKDVKVEGGGYNFHYKNGEMFFAHGEYISIGELSTKPAITPKEAETIFADYKKIPLEFVKDCQTELIIKEISLENDPVPMLVYRVRLIADYPGNDEIGIIDAQTGKVLTTERAYMDVAATGLFATRYSGTQIGITHHYNGAYHLADSTSGRAVIHTWNLNGSSYISDRVELSDNDNNWTQAEHSANYNDMALDVHWALQQIRNYLFSVHGKNGFNNSSTPAPIEAYINDGTSQGETARWNPFDKVLGFGHGFIKSKPLASLDIVAHEFGHGITHFQIGSSWTIFLNEGLSDIWAAIMEYRIRPNDVWKIAEQVMANGKACLRNFQNTNDSGADTPIADTYGTTQYNNGNQYVKGGVFSHWFYLLVNGGSGTNGIGSNYTVQGIGMDKAENIIVRAVFDGYLNKTSSYETVRTSMINAAKSLYDNDAQEVISTIDAWFAVGVGGLSYNLWGEDYIDDFNGEYIAKAIFSPYQYADAFEWYATPNSGWTITHYAGLRPMQYVKVSGGSKSAMLYVRAHRNCGWTEYVPAFEIFPNPYYSASVYPNPATTGTLNLKIEVNKEVFTQKLSSIQAAGRSVSGTESVFTARLYNDRGMMVREIRSVREGVTTFDISNLPSGIYYLYVYGEMDEKPEIMKVIVN